jgi:small subunit ribosomal protein S17
VPNPSQTPEAEAPAEEPTPDAPAEEAAPAAEAEPEEQLSPKEHRKRERRLHAGEAAPTRTVSDRAEQRAAERKSKATQRSAWRKKRREKRRAEGTHTDTTPAVVEEDAQTTARVRQGVVVSDKADKTITVRIEVQRQHRTYGKIVRSSSTLHAHDESNDANAGDTVRIVESRPLSRLKRWRLVEVVDRAR